MILRSVLSPLPILLMTLSSFAANEKVYAPHLHCMDEFDVHSGVVKDEFAPQHQEIVHAWSGSYGPALAREIGIYLMTPQQLFYYSTGLPHGTVPIDISAPLGRIGGLHYYEETPQIVAHGYRLRIETRHVRKFIWARFYTGNRFLRFGENVDLTILKELMAGWILDIKELNVATELTATPSKFLAPDGILETVIWIETQDIKAHGTGFSRDKIASRCKKVRKVCEGVEASSVKRALAEYISVLGCK